MHTFLFLGGVYLDELNKSYKYYVNVKNRKIHSVENAKKNCYCRMDNESPKYFNDLESAFLETDAHVTACKLCMGSDQKKWNEIRKSL